MTKDELITKQQLQMTKSLTAAADFASKKAARRGKLYENGALANFC